MSSVAEKLQKLEAELEDVKAREEESYERLGILEDKYKKNLGSGKNFGIFTEIEKYDDILSKLNILERDIGVLKTKQHIHVTTY